MGMKQLPVSSLKFAVSSIMLSMLISCLPCCAESFNAQVVSVTDGDTINVMHNGSRERVILFAVDCPELGQNYGQEARKFTDDCCYKKMVTIEDRGQDDKGRTIGVVLLPDGRNLNQELLKSGLAWWSDKYAPKATDLQKMHQQAKTAHLGLWSEASPVPPWIWRNGQRSVQATIKKN
jgi:micrococcal nuclease